MPLRATKFLVLACLTFWVTGAAQYVHERVEHADHDDVAALIAASKASAGDHSSHDKRPDRHNHDDCPTCQLLAHMTADGVAPPVQICAHLPCVDFVPISDRLPRVVEARSFIPIRGPPALSDRA